MPKGLSFSEMPFESVRHWLLERDPGRLEALFAAADVCRRNNVGEAVHLRGLVEISSHCRRMCLYCGLRSGNRHASRYRLSADEALDCAKRIEAAGVGTAVLQAGEDGGLTRGFISDMVRSIKQHTRCAVTLSLGERDDGDYLAWKQAGADRYLLRFETSDRALYDRLHPPRGERYDRVAALQRLRAMGYEIGSGVMFGLPGQTVETLAADLMLIAKLDLDMIGCGPFIPHPNTPLGQHEGGTLDLAYIVIALCRLLAPRAHIPATTAIATLGGESARAKALSCGANVIMPNFTPAMYREQYEIYPDKACPEEGAERFCEGLHKRLAQLGRTVGVGPGKTNTAV
ncbi:MAG: [FeFe] hydrogenase H-cluster radical SAM maturase HydE [Myxococcota bacterium]|jgi:biotin synthase|nr:[FeFe] hydrogenase H-cluster radical SAM maturase HydE [Myxococcota bacterium]